MLINLLINTAKVLQKMTFKNNKLNSYYLYNFLSDRHNSPFQNSKKRWRNWTQFLVCAKVVVNSQSQLTALKYIYIYSVAKSCPLLCDPMDCSLLALLSMGFSMQEYWSVFPCLQGVFLTQELNPCLLCLLHFRWFLYSLYHHRSPFIQAEHNTIYIHVHIYIYIYIYIWFFKGKR